LLRIVEKVRKDVAVLPRFFCHRTGSVLRISRGIVGADPHHAYAPFLAVATEAASSDRKLLNVGAMIADEGDYRGLPAKFG
jgi:hypothetical protein